MPSSRQNLKDPAWGWRSAVPLSNHTVAACGLPAMMDVALRFSYPCLPKSQHRRRLASLSNPATLFCATQRDACLSTAPDSRTFKGKYHPLRTLSGLGGRVSPECSKTGCRNSVAVQLRVGSTSKQWCQASRDLKTPNLWYDRQLAIYTRLTRQ